MEECYNLTLTKLMLRKKALVFEQCGGILNTCPFSSNLGASTDHGC